jgi:hypothetical protein
MKACKQHASLRTLLSCCSIVAAPHSLVSAARVAAAISQAAVGICSSDVRHAEQPAQQPCTQQQQQQQLKK